MDDSSSRKDAGLNVDDHIVLRLESDNTEAKKAIIEHQSTVEAETLAKFGEPTGDDVYTTEVKLEGSLLQISLVRK